MNYRNFVFVACVGLAACSGNSGNAADAGSSAVEDASVADATVVDATVVDASLPDAEVPPCEAGLVLCDGTCIDPLTDGNYCGATTCSDDTSDGEGCADGFGCDGAGSCEAFLCEAGTFDATCDPELQTGCQSGEKCSRIVESEEPFFARTTCLPDGTVSVGGGCTSCGTLPAWDNCSAGSACIDGICRETCSRTTPDPCRTEAEAFDEGQYCVSEEGYFDGAVGFCQPACNPTDNTVSGGSVTNADCGAGAGCYLNVTSGGAMCSSVPTDAVDVTQNQDCHGPGSGGCFLNGCASGFLPILNNKPVDADGTVCARYCTPVVTYAGAQSGAAGANDSCASASLGLVGGTNGETSEHQCRFIQTFYSNTQLVPEQIGMCVPVSPNVGGSWGDCTLLDWDGIKAAINGATPTESFNNLCLETPSDPMNSAIKDICIGFFEGCLSTQEKESGTQP